MPSMKLEFIPEGFIHPKSQRGKAGRYALDDPLSYSSRIRGNKFYLYFSITQLKRISGKPKLFYQILDEKQNIIADNTKSGGMSINERGFSLATHDRIDRSSGLFLSAGQIYEHIEFENNAKEIHGQAKLMSNGREISNIVSFTLQKQISSLSPPQIPPQIPPQMEEVVAVQQSTTQLQQQIQTPVAEPTPESIPVGNLNPYQLTTTIEPKWILLAIVGVGILSALIFIMRRK